MKSLTIRAVASLLLTLFACTGNSLAESSPSPDASPRLEIESYATINYYRFDWQTDPDKRDATDLERFAIEGEYRVSPKIRVKGELEIEHGGTGSAMEFDKLEEFGEFESEIEKGGEVKLEQFYVDFLFHHSFNLRLGHFLVPIGFAGTLDEPTDYFTVERSEAERAILPVLWDETGVEVFGALPARLSYRLQVVNGLDASAFTSGNWVSFGHQGRFETVNAENWAVAGRLESAPLPSTRIGVSGYLGNSRDNRPKPDLPVNAYVSLVSGHAQFVRGPLTLRALGILGNLSNSEAVTNANKNLSNLLNVKRSPVAKQAYASFVEAGVDVLALVLPQTHGHSGTVYLRFDSYDTMFRTEGNVVDNPRWDRQVYSAGVNYQPHSQVVLKSQFAHRRNGDGALDNTYSFGLGVVMF